MVYEFIGPEDGEVVVVTPGGRFSKDYGGVHELANALAAGGKRVLLWDRPNCGRSDIQLYGRSESHMRAETLGLMLRRARDRPGRRAGGSGGARDMIIFTIMKPEMVTQARDLVHRRRHVQPDVLAGVYNMGELRTVRSEGIEGVLKMRAGLEAGPTVAVNPRNAERLRAIGARSSNGS